MPKSENAVRARRDSRVEVMSNVLIDVKGGVVCILLPAKTYERYSEVSGGLVYATVYSIVNRPTPRHHHHPSHHCSLKKKETGTRLFRERISPRHHHHFSLAPETAVAFRGMLPPHP